MPRDGNLPGHGSRALDLLNFFIADVQTGFGAFVAVYLTMHKWTQIEIGTALSAGTVFALISQIPAGALVDAVANKRLIAGIGLGGVFISAILLALRPTELPVLVAQVLHAGASSVITPAIAAISLHMVGTAGLGERLGRNARYASIGNGLAAAVMGASGGLLSSASVFWLTAALCLPALATLPAIGRGIHARRQTTAPPLDWLGLRRLFADRRLLVFGGAVMCFHLANAGMLPLAGATVTMRAGALANLIIAACIMVPQAVVATTSPTLGRAAAILGRRPVLLLGWAALPVQGVLLAVLPGAWWIVAVQLVAGISAAVFGIMLPLISADLTRGTSHFNLCMGVLGMGVTIGAALSTLLGGWLAEAVSMNVAFLGLAAAGLAGVVLLWAAMPETAG
jgi:MFS family permease